MLTQRDIPVLVCLARYYLMNRRMVQSLCYPSDRDGRITRRRLMSLCRDGFVRKEQMQVINPRDDAPAPVYCLADGGRQFLAEHFKDDAYLVKPVKIEQRGHIFHALAVAQTHILLDKAVETQQRVELDAFFHEFEVINPDEPDRKQHRRLFSVLREDPRIVCAPDAAFQLSYRDYRSVFYLEQDRSTSGHRQVAAFKHKGYAELQAQQGHRRHFPSTTRDRFSVLMLCPSAKRRDALRRAFVGKDRSDLWLFASLEDLSVDTFLSEPVFYRLDDDAPRPLVRDVSAKDQEAA